MASTITDNDLKKLQEKFKAGYKGFYIPDLVAAMNLRKEELNQEKDFTDTKIYNIFNGIINNQIIRAALYEEGGKLLAKYQGDLEQVKEDTKEEIAK